MHNTVFRYTLKRVSYHVFWGKTSTLTANVNVSEGDGAKEMFLGKFYTVTADL